jgi:aminoglycoside phosphotransferase (APT) family kinase protein
VDGDERDQADKGPVEGPDADGARGRRKVAVSEAEAADGTAPPELAAVRPGEQLNWDALDAWLRPRLADLLPAATGPLQVLQFPNGAANLTFLLRLGGHELVLRRPPFGELAPGAHDMRREYTVLRHLWRHFNRAPRAYLYGDDAAILGAPFFVMERRRGEVIRGVLPASMRQHRDVGRRLGLALVDAMAELHALDPTACGLADLGKPNGFVERQVSGWARRWELARPERPLPVMEDVHRRLARAMPPMSRVSIVHNDLKLDNCQFDPADPDRVSAIFDWDMATLGDPLIDLGTLLNYWPDPGDPNWAARATHPGLTAVGLPARAEISARYAARAGADIVVARWWEAFALWKTAVVVQQLHRRWVRGESTDPRMAMIADRLPALAEAARSVLDAAGL